MALSLLALSGSVRAEDPVPVDLEEWTRARIHTRRIRIRPTWTAEPGLCLELGVDDLAVKLRGKRVNVEDLVLDREPQLTLHALLLDTSGAMGGEVGAIRLASAGYLAELDPEYDRALVATFDDSVLLLQRITDDRESLERGVENVRLGGYPGSSNASALNDGLRYVIHELTAHRDRPVLVVLSDGVDSWSVHRREDVDRLIRQRPDLTIFAIGFQLPELDSRPGSTRSFLQRLALRSNGQYFEAPTASRLEDVFRRITEMLDNEATLSVVDSSPEEEPGKIGVSSRSDGCQVQVFEDRKAADDPLRRPIPERSDGLAPSVPVPPDWRYRIDWINKAFHSADPECAGTEEIPEGIVDWNLGELWRLEATHAGIRGCALDVTMELGSLYDAYLYTDRGVDQNKWMGVKSRHLEIPVAPMKDLPTRPVQLMDSLAQHALRVVDDEISIDPRRKPREEHARPYHDFPQLVNGRMLFDLRPRIARLLYAWDEYREWVQGKLEEESRRDLEMLERRFRKLAPGATDEALEIAVRESEEGRAIVERAGRPSSLDVTRYLSAWLGDISAHDLFVAWETERLDRLLAGTVVGPDAETFDGEWTTLRDLFWVPSYARVLTLLRPVYDREMDRVGFWRIALPRPQWIPGFRRGDDYHPEWADLPLDQIPDLPMGHRTVRRILKAGPELDQYLRAREFRIEALEYSVRTRPKKRHPEVVFRETGVALTLSDTTGGEVSARLRVEADLILDTKTDELSFRAIRLSAEGDETLARLAAATERPALKGRSYD